MGLPNTQNSTKTADQYSNKSAGIVVTPGTYEAIVKDNVDATRTGALTVALLGFGTDLDDPASWKVVRYSSPFMGQTSASKRAGQDQTWNTNSPHSYGMWFVPPDIDNKVLVTFVGGDHNNGYWFGCIPFENNIHMVPGISSASWHGGGPEPVVDYNTNDPASTSTKANFWNRAKTVHDYQNQVWTRQGLLNDPDRGPGISSAFREMPSRVFGISTPGPELAASSGTEVVTDGTTPPVDKRVAARQGGHQFVMDDGTADGKSQLIRLRTSNGNMLLMNDSAGFIYMINSAGTAWFEMDKTGNVRIYSGGKFEVHGTSGITLETPGPLNLSGSSVSIVAKSSLSMSGMSATLTGMTSCSVGGMGSTSLSGSAVGVKALMCATVSGMMGVGISGACVTLNCKPPMPPSPSMPGQATPGPTAEPYTGHQSGATNSPAGSASYGAANGVNDGQAGNYGAAASFGINPSTPGYYGVYTNANGPIKFNTGFQGGFAGQAANSGATSALNQFDANSVLYTNVNINLPVATSGFAVNTKDPNVALVSGLSQGEKQNNPGDLVDRLDDPFAVGQTNGLNVYATPEDGIAALSLALDLIQADGYTTVSDVIQQYVARKGKVV